MNAERFILYAAAIAALIAAVWLTLQIPSDKYLRQKLETAGITLLCLGFVGFLFWAEHV